MAQCLGGCGTSVGMAGQKCSPCAARAVDEWKASRIVRERVHRSGETASERRARIGRMGADEYRAFVESGGEDAEDSADD